MIHCITLSSNFKDCGKQIDTLTIKSNIKDFSMVIQLIVDKVIN